MNYYYETVNSTTCIVYMSLYDIICGTIELNKDNWKKQNAIKLKEFHGPDCPRRIQPLRIVCVKYPDDPGGIKAEVDQLSVQQVLKDLFKISILWLPKTVYDLTSCSKNIDNYCNCNLFQNFTEITALKCLSLSERTLMWSWDIKMLNSEN